MFNLEMCHLLNYMFYFAIYVCSGVFTLYPRRAPGPRGVRFCTPESPGVKVVNGDGFPNRYRQTYRQVQIDTQKQTLMQTLTQTAT